MLTEDWFHMLTTDYSHLLPPCPTYSWDTKVVGKSTESYLPELWIRFPLKSAAKLFGPNLMKEKKKRPIVAARW